ncbi:MAG: hypothetical protein ACXWKR_15450, partial [Phenylobacterium sp.]
MPKPPRERRRPPAGLPDRETLLRVLKERGEADIGDLAKEFGLKGGERRALREMLRSLETEGKLGKRGRKGFSEAGALPPVGVADVVDKDVDGDMWVRLVKAGEDAPSVRLTPGRDEKVAPGLGDRLLARFEKQENGETVAKLIKALGAASPKLLGVIRKQRREVRVEPVLVDRAGDGPPHDAAVDDERGRERADAPCVRDVAVDLHDVVRDAELCGGGDDV